MKLLQKLRNVRGTQVLSYSLFFLSALTLAATVYMNLNVDVLKDWRLVLPKEQIHAGDTIVVQSLYEKTMNVTGKSTRYIECVTDGSNIYIRYPVSEAVANRGTGKTGTGIVMLMPRTIPHLPTKCRINITIEYEIFIFRKVVETAQSEPFTLHPARVSEEDEESAQQETSQTLTQDSGSVSSNLFPSYPNTTPVETYNQQDISQDTPSQPERQLSAQPEPVPSQPRNPVQNLTDAITDLLGGI